MSCAIKVSGSRNCSFTNVAMGGFDIGIDVEDSDGLILSQVDFGDCTTGMKGKNVKGLNAHGCTHGIPVMPSPLISSTQNNMSFSYALQYLSTFGYNPY